MKIVKYICDCCGKSVKNENELEPYAINGNLCDICEKCESRLEETLLNEFKKIKSGN